VQIKKKKKKRALSDWRVRKKESASWSYLEQCFAITHS
jgi:hypothetical protein